MTVPTGHPTRRRVRIATFLPAVGLITADATQIDAAIVTSAYRSASPAPKDSLTFPWYGGLAGQTYTSRAFTGLGWAMSRIPDGRSDG